MKKDLFGYESTHYATSDGKIFRKDHIICRKHKGTYVHQPISAKELVGNRLSQKGYKRVNIKNKVFFVHRLIALTFIENTEKKPFINHKNGIKTDNRVENLEWCTNKENRNHAVANNLQARGESISHLKNEDIFKIRKLYGNNISQYEIAKMFNCCQQTISKIVRRSSWTHI